MSADIVMAHRIELPPAVVPAGHLRTMQVSRRPRFPGSTDLGGPDTPGEDYLIVVDGAVIGGTYWCGADDVPHGRRWASWGPAGLSMGHRRRETAEQAQVRAYVVNPDVTDREIAEEQRAVVARRARKDAETADRTEQRRRRRLGDDLPGPAIWTLPSHHFLFAADADVAAVAAWLGLHGLEEVDGLHEIRIEQRASRRVIAVERRAWAGEATETWVTTCTAAPPPVDTTARPDLVALLAEHHPTTFPLIDYGREVACAACTRQLTGPTTVTAWPCAVFIAARDHTADPDAAGGMSAGRRKVVGGVRYRAGRPLL
jgi:hypothetical protein